MNILLDTLPQAVQIGGTDYHIHTDFRNWIRFELLMVDGKTPFENKVIDFLKLYCSKLPANIEDAFLALVTFYSGADKKNQDKGNGNEHSKSPIYSFEHDSEYIYAAFLGQYGIDLQSTNLHWWQFKALFKSLNDTNQIVKIMEYRSVNLSKIKDKEQKAFYRKMKALYRLPDERTEEEKERDMIRGLEGLF